MPRIAHFEPVRVTVGVDTHKDEHVAVVIDQFGALLGEHRIPTTTSGYKDLARWAGDGGWLPLIRRAGQDREVAKARLLLSHCSSGIS